MPSNNPPGPYAHDTEKARLLGEVMSSRNKEASIAKAERITQERRAENKFKSQQDNAYRKGMASGLFDSSDPDSKSKAIEYGAQQMRERADDHGRDGDNSSDGRLAERELERRLSRYDQEEQDEERRRKFIERARELESQRKSNEVLKGSRMSGPRQVVRALKPIQFEPAKDGPSIDFKRRDHGLQGQELEKYISDIYRSSQPREQRLKEEAIKISEEKTYDQVKGKILLEDKWIKGKIYSDAKNIFSNQTPQSQENLLKLSKKKQSLLGRLSFGNPKIGIQIDNNKIMLTKDNLNLLLDQMKERRIDQVDNSKDGTRLNELIQESRVAENVNPDAQQNSNIPSVESTTRTPPAVKPYEFNKDQFLKNTDNILKTFNDKTRKQFEKIDSLETLPDKVFLDGKFQTISPQDFREVANVYNEKLSEHVTSQIMGYSKLDELFSADQQKKLAQSKNSDSDPPPSIKCRCNQPDSYNSELYTITPDPDQYSKILKTFKEKNLKEKGSANQALEVFGDQTPEVQKQIKSHTTLGGKIRGAFGMRKIPEIIIDNKKVDLDKKTYKKFLENYQKEFKQKELEEKSQSKGQEQEAESNSGLKQKVQRSFSDSNISKVPDQDSQLSSGQEKYNRSEKQKTSLNASMEKAKEEARGVASSLSFASLSKTSGQGSPAPQAQLNSGQGKSGSR